MSFGGILDGLGLDFGGSGYGDMTDISKRLTELAKQRALDQLMAAVQAAQLQHEANLQAMWSMVEKQAASAITRSSKIADMMNQI
jgi:hypothetical protein